MDYNILKSFRIFYQDYVLLYDAVQEYHRVRPTNKSLKEFTSGIAAMIEVEASIEKVPDIVIVRKGYIDEEYSMLGLALEFFRSVLIEFIVDEWTQVMIYYQSSMIYIEIALRLLSSSSSCIQILL
jgi:hypothetical protein